MANSQAFETRPPRVRGQGRPGGKQRVLQDVVCGLVGNAAQHKTAQQGRVVARQRVERGAVSFLGRKDKFQLGAFGVGHRAGKEPQHIHSLWPFPK